jgi:alanine transaminase
MVNPPSAGDESYAVYVKERDEILSSLNRRALKMTHALNELQGVSCNAIDGALYAFPSISLPGNQSRTPPFILF